MRVCICFLLITLMLAGCAADSGLVGARQMAAPGGAPEAEPLDCVFVVDRNAPRLIKSAAESYCGQLARDSGGVLRFAVEEATDAFAELSAGRAQLAFAPIEKLPDTNSRLAALNAPFTYRDYRHFSMSVNSDEILGIVGDSLAETYRAKPLAGFYAGASYLLTSTSLESTIELMELFASGEERIALAVPSSPLREGLTELGFTVLSQPSYAQRFRRLTEGEAVIAEFSLAELSASQEPIDSSLHVIPSLHSVDIQLLFASSDFWEELPETSRAMMTEAYSRLFSAIDESILLQETMLQQEMTERDMLQPAFPEAIRNVCADAWYAGLEPDPLRNYLSGLISNI